MCIKKLCVIKILGVRKNTCMIVIFFHIVDFFFFSLSLVVMVFLQNRSFSHELLCYMIDFDIFIRKILGGLKMPKTKFIILSTLSFCLFMSLCLNLSF